MDKNSEKFGKVAVLMGGSAAERVISLKSGQAVFEALRRQGVEASLIDVEDSVIEALAGRSFDRVFNIIHGRGGEDGVLQGVLEVLKIPYTGSGVMASALTMDKLRTKLCWQGYGLPTPFWQIIESEADIDKCIDKLGFPVIVKPAQEGSSIGMSKAESREELLRAVEIAREFRCDIYAERWIEGKEYTIAVLSGKALPIIHLETPRSFYDFEAKYQASTTRYHCPCGLNEEEERKLGELAITACAVVGVTGWARVDAFIAQGNRPQLIEVNTVPGMTDHSLVPMAAKQAGIDFEELVLRILATSFK